MRNSEGTQGVSATGPPASVIRRTVQKSAGMAAGGDSATVSLDGTVGGPNPVAPVTQAPGGARRTAGNVAGSVNELADGTVARWTLP
jgi:hypothetical protein